ncbi:LysR substrate-binding domain-containing protein [Buttiauxella ferragutiae]|jgi:DNA-binding transcriptional LysR family regulator|uniref:LysR substrate-binding domain-containing protein n=1 Tax=Buttiauxella ferragutiae TaxID=82989 RepID=UPI001E619426|nr:LysR substrate-binding domain-containing protein [Buttiauxella ferragutiae]MCE0826753.1 LysR substrate-binding domain-containing protein [Buttiauxella ferragutiae]UNK59732.1 LysR substrate-binding domain-containing protein [Buttiauxella ferragutiae]
MLNLINVFSFVQVVNHEGFTAAARVLHISKSTLSLRVQQLESELGVQLLNRNTRKLGLTNVGGEFYHHAQSLLREVEAAENVGRQRQSEPSGTIRITSSVTVAQFALRTVLPGFMDKFPKVSIEHHATDIITDIIGEGYDLAIRGHSGPLPDSSLIQRPLVKVSWHLFASESYLTQKGAPQHPDDLLAHNAIAFGRGTAQRWSLRHQDGSAVIVPYTARFVSNNMVALKQFAEAGLGLVALPDYVCREDMAEGRLARVLPLWCAGDSQLTAVAPVQQGWLSSVRELLDYLVDALPHALASRRDPI